jgi:hypothetical protein
MISTKKTFKIFRPGSSTNNLLTFFYAFLALAKTAGLSLKGGAPFLIKRWPEPHGTATITLLYSEFVFKLRRRTRSTRRLP